MIGRRGLLRGAAALVLASRGDRRAEAEAGLFPFADDLGRPVFNYRLPSDPSVDGVPGVVWAGPPAADVMLIEFFDYNCPYCGRAAPDFEALLTSDGRLKLGLVNDPVLSIGSLQAAKVQQAILRSSGPAKAYAFHLRLFGAHGAVDGPLALGVASALGLDAKAIEAQADLPQIGAALKRQAHLADALGFTATPSFVIDGIGFSGYPGPASMARAVAAVRRCDKLACG